MQHDEIIWNIINQNFCSFKTRADTQDFCRHKYSVTGLCNRRSCPLANSNYATIREHNGRIYLCIKTVERAHTPRNMWEKIKLKQNYEAALKQIDQHLAYWPSFLKLKCKQRLTKITQYLIRMRKLALKPQPALVNRKKKVERREATRELKALRAAHITKVVENELLDRLRQGTYDGVYNFPEETFNTALDEEGEDDQVEDGAEEEEQEPDLYVEAYDDEDEEGNEAELAFDDEDEAGLDELFGETDDEGDEDDDEDDEGDEGDDDDDDEDDEDAQAKKAKLAQEERKQALASAAALLLRRKARSKVSIEYEKEAEAAQSSQKSTNW
eukprot:m.254473 g.254473  ORF g.254473 m.254473 type:complete len:327 (-) comp18098_c0_seq1:244-1224(-)